MKFWFISDIHIKNTKERNSELLLRFLHYLSKNPSEHQLYLLGDIFDFWLSDGSAFYTSFKEIVDAIVSFKEQGGKVIYLEGNHDFHIDVFWYKKHGIPVYEDVYEIFNDGLHLRLEHGDFINPNDQAYLNYRAFVRKPWVEFIGHCIPSRFMKWFGDRKSQQSRKKTAAYSNQNPEVMIDMIRTYAKNLAEKYEFDVLITGHMHIQDDYQFQSEKYNKTIRSINLGSWLVKEPQALCFENGAWKWVNLVTEIII